jgi:esterase/lipase superfamily enzyme
LLGAFEVLAIDRKHVLPAINQTILAAADVDSDSMSQLGRHAISNAKRTTSYISDIDTALKLSGWLHSFPRVGLTPPTYILKGMDTVLVNGDDLGLANHGYISSSSRVLADIFSILKDDTPPKDRFSMERAVVGNDTYWRLKN